MTDEKWLCERPHISVKGIEVQVFRCWSRRRCWTCATLSAWDDQAWIKEGVSYWLAQGTSLVFLTLTLESPEPYGKVQEGWRQFKQALTRRVSDREGYPGGLPFVRVYERQEERYQRTGEVVIHIHAIFAGLQYRGDRLSGKPNRVNHKKAESLGVKGAKVTKEELQHLAVRYGFGPVLDITQVQAGPGDLKAGLRVAKYLAKYLSKHEEIGHWLPKGSQLVTNSRGTYSWVPGKTRMQVRRERSTNALAFSQGAGPAPKSRARAGAGPDEVGAS